MRKSLGRVLSVFAVVVVLQLTGSQALAVDTMADWTGQNNVFPGPFVNDPEVRNNYGLISNTSVGGQFESKINFTGDPIITAEQPLDYHHIHFSDPMLEGPTLDFNTPLHMEGTISFHNDQATEPNLLFGWYNSDNTAHRIGLGISNFTATQASGAQPGFLRMDFGYASTSYPNPNPPPTNLGNRFYYVSSDGNQPNTSATSVMPNGTYPFTFDFTPGPETPGGGSGTLGGMMSATVGNFFKAVVPLESEPEDFDFFTFDRFGFVQRATTNALQHGFYNVVFSDVTYTGGTAAAAESGDFDGNGHVNNADLGIWDDNFGTATDATFAMGNADGGSSIPPESQDVDGVDFLIWQRTYTGTSPIAVVPEPGAMALLAIGGISAMMRRSRRR